MSRAENGKAPGGSRMSEMETFRIQEFKKRLEWQIFPAVPVPFDSRGRLHESAQAAFVEYISSGPAAGVAVWVHSGRGLHIDTSLRKEVMRSWRDGLPGRIIIAGVGAKADTAKSEVIRRTLEMAELAIQLGADAFLVFPPVSLKGDEEAIYSYHVELCRFGIPLILFYLYEWAGGVPYSKGLLERLLSLDMVAGVKSATLDNILSFQDLSRLVASSAPEKLFITGEDRMFGYSLMRGARAALVGLGAACTSLQKSLIDSYRQGDFSRFIQLSSKVDRLAEVTFIEPMEGYIRRMLLVLAALGILPLEACYDPFGPPVPESHIRNIERVLAEIGEK